jgi:hypothetical protein
MLEKLTIELTISVSIGSSPELSPEFQYRSDSYIDG